MVKLQRARAIAHEAYITKRLRAEGWTGEVLTLRYLASCGAELRKRYENACSYEWASGPAFEALTEDLERHTLEVIERTGLRGYLQRDPRGATVYVARHPITDRDYSTKAECLYPAEEA